MQAEVTPSAADPAHDAPDAPGPPQDAHTLGDPNEGAAAVQDVPALPERIHWRPVLSPLAIAMGALADVGFEVLLHQLGLALLSVGSIAFNVLEGAALGVAAPSLGALAGAWWVNRRLKQMEAA